jgi:hypothetical protein
MGGADLDSEGGSSKDEDEEIDMKEFFKSGANKKILSMISM